MTPDTTGGKRKEGIVLENPLCGFRGRARPQWPAGASRSEGYGRLRKDPRGAPLISLLIYVILPALKRRVATEIIV